MTRYTIYWLTRDVSVIDRIRRRFGITEGMTVNGENAVEVKTDRDLADLADCERQGLIQLRKKKNKDYENQPSNDTHDGAVPSRAKDK